MPSPNADAIIEKLGLNAALISKVTGVSEKTAQRWLDTDDLPEPARRCILLVYGLAKPEDYRP